ncbi:hypothetical protein ACO2Q9_09915 [Variovorax sp. VNK109]|uniref:hypothetical protein n=1 Tax=Variovorax sp. VNK109 TaxID=3400919 RepID=UPI003C0657A5
MTITGENEDRKSAANTGSSSERDAVQRIRASLDGTYVPPTKDRFDINSDALYAAVGGLELPQPEFELFPGLRLRQTYCRVIAPYLMAYAPPARPELPHPGPWTALGEGGLTVHAELELAANTESLGFDRLNTVWFTVALLRLRLGQPLRVPVVADRPFSEIANHPDISNLVAIELQVPLVRTAPLRAPTEEDLRWVRINLEAAATLMKDPVFNRALQTLDRAVSIANPGAGIVIAWAAIEALLRPGQQRITEKVCKALATMLHPPGSARDRAYTDIAASYEARGGAAHAGRMPDSKQFIAAFSLARSALMTSIEHGALPSVDELLTRWTAKA